MHFKLKAFLVILVTNVLFHSCSPALYKPSQKNFESYANIDELITGRKLYIKKCSSCHTLFLPEKFDAELWKMHVSKMEQRAKLSGSENELILKYLTKGKNK